MSSYIEPKEPKGKLLAKIQLQGIGFIGSDFYFVLLGKHKMSGSS